MRFPKPERRGPKPQKRIKTRVLPGRKRREAKAAGGVDPDTWAAIVRHFGGRCAYCQTAPGTVQEHVKAIAKGGAHEVSNLVLACEPCNLRKGQQTWPVPNPHQWMLTGPAS